MEFKVDMDLSFRVGEVRYDLIINFDILLASTIFGEIDHNTEIMDGILQHVIEFLLIDYF